MWLAHLCSRNAIVAVAVIVVSLMIAVDLDTEDSSAHVHSSSQDDFVTEGGEPQKPPPADLMSLMQGAKIRVDLLGQIDKPANPSVHSQKDPTPDMDDTSFFSGPIRTSKSKTTGVSLPGRSSVFGGASPAAWHVALNMGTALRQMVAHRFMRAGTTESTSTLAVVMIILLVFCTCVGALSIAYPSKFSFLGEGHHRIPEEPAAVPVLETRELMLQRNNWPPPPGGLASQGGTPGPFFRSALSPFASALMPTPMMPSDHIENTLETEPAQPDPQEAPIPPPLCPTLVMPVCEARFGVPMYELAQLGSEGEVTIVGLSGNPLLRAVVRKIGNARTLEISMPEQNSAPRATITPSMMELAGHSQQGCRALEIRGMRGSFYGVLEMRSSGACYVIREGQTVLTIDGDAESLQLSVKSSVGLQLASVRCSAEPFGGVDHVEIRVEPGVDTVLVLAVVLAVLLLSPYLAPADQ